MKKIICFLVFTILVSSFCSAISTDIKESYLQGETVISAISGNILEPITAEKVEFRRGHVLVPFDYDLSKIGDKYYIWFITPENQMNYTLIIKNITTTLSGKVQQISYEKNFTISGNLNDYSIKPGFISTESDFDIKVQLNEDNDKAINVNFLEESEIILKPGENILKFSISGINETRVFNITIGKYNLPAQIRVNRTTEIMPAENETQLNLTNLSEIKTENLSEDEKSKIEEERKKYACFEYPGKICAADEKCTGEIITSSDGQCCVGLNAACSKAGGETGTGSLAWIGYLLAAVVIIAAVFLWLRYRQVKPETNPIEKKVQLAEKKKI